MRTFVNTCGAILIIVFLVSFAMKNTQPVEINYYSEIKYQFPAWGIVAIPFFIGVVFGNLLDVFQRFRLKREIKKLRKGMQGRQTN
jgi:uncharacterized integral membrane protein